MGQVNILKNKYRFSDLKKRKQIYKQNMFVMYNFTDRGLIWLFNNCLVKSHKVHKSSNSGFIGLSVECNLIIRKKRKNSVNFSIFYNIYSVTIWAFCIAINEAYESSTFLQLKYRLWQLGIFLLLQRIYCIYIMFSYNIYPNLNICSTIKEEMIWIFHIIVAKIRSLLSRYIFVVSVYFWYLGIFVLWQISIYKGYIVYYFLKCQN